MQAEGRYAFIFPQRNQAKDTAWRYLRRCAEPLLAKPPNESEFGWQHNDLIEVKDGRPNRKNAGMGASRLTALGTPFRALRRSLGAQRAG